MRPLACLVAMLAAACAPVGGKAPVAPERPARIVSLDYCADQFVLKLADREQIAAVSPDAEKDFSYMRAAASGLPKVRSNAEDVLALRPDLVVRAYGGGPNAGPFLEQAGTPVAQVGFVQDFDGVRETIRSMAAAFGHPERGDAIVAEMDARLTAAAQSGSNDRVLYMTPAGVTTGEGTLVHEMIEAAGLANFVNGEGWMPIPLERLAYERPESTAAAFFGARTNHEDNWSLMRHPMARRQLSGKQAVMLEGAWTACGGWFLVEAVEALAAGRAGEAEQ